MVEIYQLKRKNIFTSVFVVFVYTYLFFIQKIMKMRMNATQS